MLQSESARAAASIDTCDGSHEPSGRDAIVNIPDNGSLSPVLLDATAADTTAAAMAEPDNAPPSDACNEGSGDEEDRDSFCYRDSARDRGELRKAAATLDKAVATKAANLCRPSMPPVGSEPDEVVRKPVADSKAGLCIQDEKHKSDCEAAYPPWEAYESQWTETPVPAGFLRSVSMMHGGDTWMVWETASIIPVYRLCPLWYI